MGTTRLTSTYRKTSFPIGFYSIPGTSAFSILKQTLETIKPCIVDFEEAAAHKIFQKLLLKKMTNDLPKPSKIDPKSSKKSSWRAPEIRLEKHTSILSKYHQKRLPKGPLKSIKSVTNPSLEGPGVPGTPLTSRNNAQSQKWSPRTSKFTEKSPKSCPRTSKGSPKGHKPKTKKRQ